MKRSISRYLLLCLFTAWTALWASAGYEGQFNETWITQFGAKGYYDGNYIRGEYDSPRDNAIDTEGNTIIVGMTEGNLTGDTAEQRYCGFVAKVTSDGERSWTHQCKAGAITYGSLTGVVVDEQNNIYVTGPYNNDVLVMKLDASGRLLWSKVFGEQDASEEPKAIHRAANGALYITGVLRPDDYHQPEQIFLAHLTAEGQNVLVKTYGSQGEDVPVGVDTDSHGGVYIAGYTNGDLDGEKNSGAEDIFLTKFDRTGKRLWTRLFGSATAPDHQRKSELTRAMTIAPNDIIYVAGDTQGNLGGRQNSGNYDMFVTKFSTEGVVLGTVMQGGANLNNPNYGAADHVGDIVVASDGSIYLFGTTTGQFPGSGNNGNDYSQLVLVKFKPTGAYAWAHQYGPCCANRDNAAVALQKDNADNLYPLARVNQYLSSYYDTRFPDIAALKLTEINATKFSLFAENIFSEVNAAGAVEREGKIVVSGSGSHLETYVKEFLFDVTLSGPVDNYAAYGRNIPAMNHPVSRDSTGNTYVISMSNEDIEQQPANGYDATVVTKYDTTGTIVWVKRFNSTGGNNIPRAITYDNNRLFIVGITEGNIDGGNDNNGSDNQYGVHRIDGFVLALNASDGTQMWVDQFSEGNTYDVWMYDVVVDANGYVHIVGGNNSAIVLNTYRAEGSVVSFEQYGNGVSMGSQMAMAVNGTNLYITGRAIGDFVPNGAVGNGDIFLIKIDKSSPAQGKAIWKRQRGTTTFDEAHDIVLGHDGNLYIVGFSSGNLDGENAGGTDMIIEAYSTGGVLLAARQRGTLFDDKAYGIFSDSEGGVVVTGRTHDSAVIQRYTMQKSDLTENAPLIVCIDEALGADPHHVPILEELESITSLTCNSQGLTSLYGTEYMTNLLYLDVGHNTISDLTPLGRLFKLDYLNLSYNSIANLEPIKELKTLKYLHLTGNAISDISVLLPFTLLETLTIGENRIEDISALRNMTLLRFLSIEKNLIRDIGTLQGLTSLQVLYLGGNMIRDFSPIPAGVEVHGKETQNIHGANMASIVNYLLN